MKRAILLSAICLSFLTATLFTSCDKESGDSNLNNPELVGKPYFTMTLKDTIYTKSENDLKVTLNNRNEITISVEGLGKKGNDVFEINLLKLQEGNFPTNVNAAVYLYAEDMELATSQDMDRPDWVTGMVKVTKVNKTARVISGSFDIRMLPFPLNKKYKDQFTVVGEFENLPYERFTADSNAFIYVVADGVALGDLQGSATHNPQNNKVTIEAVDSNYKKQNLKLNFPADIEEGTHSFEDFSANYVSRYGVKYFSNAEDSALEGGYLKIDKIEEEKQGTKTFKKYYGRFDFKLREESGVHILKLTEGEFIFRVEMKQQAPPPIIEL